LAGSEAAWQLAQAGVKVDLYEMRPGRSTSAHQTDQMAELVCSNSLKSEALNSAPWLLKQELRRLGSLLLPSCRALFDDRGSDGNSGGGGRPPTKQSSSEATRTCTTAFLPESMSTLMNLVTSSLL
jgi:hypothetical protein